MVDYDFRTAMLKVLFDYMDSRFCEQLKTMHAFQAIILELHQVYERGFHRFIHGSLRQYLCFGKTQCLEGSSQGPEQNHLLLDITPFGSKSIM